MSLGVHTNTVFCQHCCCGQSLKNTCSIISTSNVSPSVLHFPYAGCHYQWQLPSAHIPNISASLDESSALIMILNTVPQIYHTWLKLKGSWFSVGSFCQLAISSSGIWPYVALVCDTQHVHIYVETHIHAPQLLPGTLLLNPCRPVGKQLLGYTQTSAILGTHFLSPSVTIELKCDIYTVYIKIQYLFYTLPKSPWFPQRNFHIILTCLDDFLFFQIFLKLNILHTKTHWVLHTAIITCLSNALNADVFFFFILPNAFYLICPLNWCQKML